MDKRLYESLHIYLGHSEGLLAALYNTKLSFDPEGNPYSDSVVGDGTFRTGSLKADQPKILSEQSFQTLNKALIKKFPEVPELSKVCLRLNLLVQGYQALISEAKNLLQDLAPFYIMFKDIAEFTENALVILLSFEKLSGLNYTHHHVVASTFFKFLTNFVSIQLAVADLGNEKKSVVAAYGILYSHVNGGPEPYFNKITKYFGDYEKPHAYIPEVLSPLGLFLTSLLQTYYNEVLMNGFIPVEMLRKDNAYNVLANLKANTFEERKLRLLPMFNQFIQQVIISCFCCPSEVLKQQPCLDVLKFAASNTIAVPIFRSEFFNTVSEYESLAKANSKVSKIKSIITDNYGSAHIKNIAFHADRRDYLRFALGQILNIGADRPHLFAGKLPIIEALISMAKEEIKWYFAHLDKTIGSKYPKFSPKSPNVAQAMDTNIFELIQTVSELKRLLLLENNRISQYYAQHCSGVYANQLDEIVNEMLRKNAASESVVENLRFMVSALRNCTAESNMMGLRLNYCRLIVHFHSIDSTIAISTIPEFVNLMNEIYYRSRYVDALGDVLDEIAGFEFLFYYRTLLVESVEDVLRNSSKQIVKLQICPLLSHEFIKNASAYYPKEIDRIATRCLEFVDDFFNISCSYGANFFHAISSAKVNFDNQVLPESTLKFAPDRREKKQKKGAEKPLEAGFESKDVNSPVVSNLQIHMFSLINIVKVLGNFETFTIASGTFSSWEYFKDAIAAKIRPYLFGNALVDESPTSPKDQGDECPFLIKRPSVLLNEISSYIATISLIDNICPLNIEQFIVDMIMEQVDYNLSRKSLQDWDAQLQNTKQKTKFRKLVVPQNTPFGAQLIMWYSEVIRDKANYGVETISLLKKCVYSSASNSLFQAQLYLNFQELCALCELIGPLGVRNLDDRLIAMTQPLIKDLKEIAGLNQEILLNMDKVWLVEGKVEESIKKLKQLDEFTQKSISLGFILAYRMLIFDALDSVTQMRCSSVYRVIKTAHERYPDNVFGLPDFVGIDQIANFIGLQKHADFHLRNSLQQFCRNPAGDAKIFNLLPIMYAIVTRQFAMDEKFLYNIKSDVFDNNAHLVPITLNMLLTNFIAITSPGNMDALQGAQKLYLQVASTLLLRIKADKEHNDSLMSAFILLQKFLSHSNVLPKNALEEFLPYAIVRQTNSDLFRKAGSVIKFSAEEAQQEQAEGMAVAAK